MLRPDPNGPALPHFEGWETIEKLGEGGMCEVYRARPVGGGPERAVKLLTDRSDVSIRRFVDEAALLQRIDHPNVVQVHYIAPDTRPPWLVMDLLGGRDLDETMRVEGPMDPERAARLFGDLADGLAAVHRAGVRHRDIKPANIRLGVDGVARLIDFGIARDASASRHTRQGFVVGTASYLPPEIFVEDDAHGVQDTEACDVYALGQTLCEALAGRVAHQFKDGAEAALLVRIMRDKLDREYLDPRDLGARVPDELARIVRRATAREPEERTPTAAKLAQELRDWLLSRTSASIAPISRVDLGHVSLPPSPAPGIGRGSPHPGPPRHLPGELGAPLTGSMDLTEPPVPALPETPVAPPAVPKPPAPRRGLWVAAYGAVGALGVAGTALVVVGLLGVALLGIGALWAFRPVSDPEPGKIRAAVVALGPQLSSCDAGQGTFSLTVDAGRVQKVAPLKDSTFGKRAEKCVTRVLETASYPKTKKLTVEVPIVVR
jgi:serine/threonine protein kinase